VSRKKVGDEVEVLSGTDLAFQVQLESVGKASAQGRIISSRTLPKMQRPAVHLAFCFPKPANFELVLEKAVELGCAGITPILSEFTQVTKKADFPSKKRDRWLKIIKAATEQTGRADLMALEEPLTLSEFVDQVNRKPKAACLFMYEGKTPLALQDHLRSTNLNEYEEVWALIGSEGGFSQAEVTLLNDKGIVPISMGQQILRTETACVSILSVLKYELGHMR
jgi:16S rRNA (uracil1498-N3)-methyltransferase